MYILFLIILIICIFYIINKKFEINNIPRINNSFNEYGKKYIVPLLDNPKFNTYVDKLEYKKLCKKYNIKTFKTLYILNKPNDIYKIFDTLPISFVVKSNKGSGRNYIVRNKNQTSPEIILNKLKNYNDPYNPKKEPQYKYTTGKIYIEEYINPVPPDIKLFIYKNKPTILWTVEDRFGGDHISFYKFKGNKLVYYPDCVWGRSSKNKKSKLIEFLIKNNKINELLELTKKINVDLPLVRYDFYWYKNEFYGGEITLSSEIFEAKISENCAKYSIT